MARGQYRKQRDKLSDVNRVETTEVWGGEKRYKPRSMGPMPKIVRCEVILKNEITDSRDSPERDQYFCSTYTPSDGSFSVRVWYEKRAWMKHWINPAYVAMAVSKVDMRILVKKNISLLDNVVAGIISPNHEVDDEMLKKATKLMNTSAGWKWASFEALHVVKGIEEAKLEPVYDSLNALRHIQGNIQSVGVLGNLREGKSTMMQILCRINEVDGSELMMRHDNRSREELSNQNRSIFETSADMKPLTKGVNMIMMPHLSASHWIAYFDFEGLGSYSRPRDECSMYDTRLFALSQCFLNDLCYNIKGGMDNYVIEKIEATKIVANLLLGKEKQRQLETKNINALPKPQLHILIRDCSLQNVEQCEGDQTEGVGKEVKDDFYYEGLLKEHESSINALFDKTSVHTFPIPVSSEYISSVGDLDLSLLDNKFVKSVLDFKRSLMKLSDNQILCTGEEMKNNISDHVHIVNSGKPQILHRSILIANLKLNQEFRRYEEKVELLAEKLEGDMPMDCSSLENIWLQSKEDTVTTFKGECVQILCKMASPQSIEQTDFIARLQEEFEYKAGILKARNKSRTLEDANIVYKNFMKKKPQNDQLIYPNGSEDALKKFTNDLVKHLKDNLQGQKEVVQNFIATKEESLVNQCTYFESVNRQKKVAAELAQSHHDEIQQHLNQSRELQEKLKNKTFVKDELERALEKLEKKNTAIQTHLQNLKSEHSKQMAEQLEHHQKMLDSEKAAMKKEWEKKEEAMREEFEELQKKVNEEKNKTMRIQEAAQREIEDWRICSRF